MLTPSTLLRSFQDREFTAVDEIYAIFTLCTFHKERERRWSEEEVKMLPQCAFNLIPISVEKFIFARIRFHYDYKKRFKVTLHDFNVSKLPKCCRISFCYALLE